MRGRTARHEVFVAHPVAVLAVAYACAWRKEYKSRVHINVAGLEAFLREEARLACRTVSKRALFGLDSQVSLSELGRADQRPERLSCLEPDALCVSGSRAGVKDL